MKVPSRANTSKIAFPDITGSSTITVHSPVEVKP
jgi:hypothetical protein